MQYIHSIHHHSHVTSYKNTLSIKGNKEIRSFLHKKFPTRNEHNCKEFSTTFRRQMAGNKFGGEVDDFINKAVRCTNPYNLIMENSSLLSRSNPSLCKLQCNHKTGNIVYVIYVTRTDAVLVPVRHMAERGTW